MNSKKLFQKHLDLLIPTDVYLSERQLADLRYQASINAIDEAIKIDPPIITRVMMIDEVNKYFSSNKPQIDLDETPIVCYADPALQIVITNITSVGVKVISSEYGHEFFGEVKIYRDLDDITLRKIYDVIILKN